MRVDPLPAALAWPEKVSLKIPVPGRDDNILSPSSQSPFVAFGFSAYESQGAQIWNLAANKQVGLIKGKPPNASSRIISPDGRYMAIKVLEKNVFNKIEIWSFETGQLVRTMQDIKEMNLVILDFGPPDQLFVYTYGNPGGKYIHKIQVWDIPKGTLLREIVTDGEQVDQYRYAFSPGRRYFATLKSDNNLNVFDLTTAKRAGHIKLPSASQLEQNLNPEGLRFSPDGTQLVALLDGSAETRIMVIDVQTGKHDPERDSAFPGRLLSAIDGAPSYKGPKLECLHNGSYLIAGSLWIDGDTGRIVWYLDYGADKYNFAQRIPTPNGLIVPEGPDEVRHLVVLETPWEAITASLKAIDAEAPAAVRPGQPVSLDIKIGKLQHGTKEETTAALTEALTERLAAAGIEIKEGQPTVLRVIYGEAAGDTLQESTRDRNNPFGAGTPTGRSVQATKAGLVVSWVRDKETKPLWTKNILVNPSFLIIRGDITAEKARTAMFEGLKNTLVSQPMP